jgi:hypothetical protein
MTQEYTMKKPAWTLIIGITAILFGVINGFTAMIDLSQIQSWQSLNAIFAPAQEIITSQGADAANFALGMIAPPPWFVKLASTLSWAGIALGLLFVAAGIALILYRRFGMWLLTMALVLNIALQAFYSAEAVRSMSVQAIVIPARAFWLVILNVVLLIVIGVGSLRWFRFAHPLPAAQ